MIPQAIQHAINNRQYDEALQLASRACDDGTITGAELYVIHTEVARFTGVRGIREVATTASAAPPPVPSDPH